MSKSPSQARPLGGRLFDLIPPLMFGLALVACGFAYGVFVGFYREPPFATLKASVDAAQATLERIWPPESPYLYEVNHDRAGAQILDPERVAPGVTFLAGVFAGIPKGVLIDLAGNVLHEWQIDFSDVWQEAPHLLYQAPDDLIHWHGAHLFPDGSVVFNFESGNFPFGGGLIKLDKDSNLLWALARNTHHDLEVLEDGTIVVASQIYHEQAVPAGAGLEPPYLEDTVLWVTPEGEVIKEISVLGALLDSDRAGILRTPGWNEHNDDPLHLNDVEVVGPDFARALPTVEAGDLLVSLRDRNTIAVLDQDSQAVVWSMTGLFIEQHDPDLLPNGNLLIFDNRGGSARGRGSRILEIDPVSQAIVWCYEGSAGRPFYTKIRGKQERLANGNILVVEAGGGRVFEVTHEPEPELVWEYVNRSAPDEPAGLITSAHRLPPGTLTFLGRE